MSDFENGVKLGIEIMRLAAMDAATGAQDARPGRLEFNTAMCQIADEIEEFGHDEEIKLYRKMALEDHPELAGDSQFIKPESVGAVEDLFQAANTASTNLQTSMDLKSHPESCECYGCNLVEAVVMFALSRAQRNVKKIVDLEKKYEMSFPPESVGLGVKVGEPIDWEKLEYESEGSRRRIAGGT